MRVMLELYRPEVARAREANIVELGRFGKRCVYKDGIAVEDCLGKVAGTFKDGPGKVRQPREPCLLKCDLSFEDGSAERSVVKLFSIEVGKRLKCLFTIVVCQFLLRHMRIILSDFLAHRNCRSTEVENERTGGVGLN